MKIKTRIFLSYLLVFGTGFYFLVYWVLGDLRLRYLESVEEVLVDQSHLWAEVTGHLLASGALDTDWLHRIYDAAYARKFAADIYGFRKRAVDAGLYITDHNGQVIFDARQRGNEGADFSRWRDVHLTLKGAYGARSTRLDRHDPLSNVLHVAAPVIVDGETRGVLTILKSTRSINRFMQSAKADVIRVGLMAAVAVMIVSYLAVSWLTHPIARLTQYANDVREGRRAALPPMDNSEIGAMGRAFENMREALEGRRYVEQYIQTFTHEIKSPLSAIQGAAELLEEPMTEAQRQRFVANIRNESGRIERVVERLLQLAAVENLKTLEQVERFALKSMVDDLLEGLRALTLKKKLQVRNRIPAPLTVSGDRFLLKQGCANLLQNAVDFSPTGGRLQVAGRRQGDWIEIRIDDDGPGVPDYARHKIFNRFFSLPRPETDKKSTGLGLNFVKEVAALHQGRIQLLNRDPEGCRSIFRLPA